MQLIEQASVVCRVLDCILDAVLLQQLVNVQVSMWIVSKEQVPLESVE